VETQNLNFKINRFILVVLVSFVISICIGAGYFAYISYQSLQPIEVAEITSYIPPAVEVGETFQLEVVIENTSDEALTLSAINIGAELVESIQIGDSTPIFEYRNQYEVLGNQLVMFMFNELILAGETLSVCFDARAESVGDFTGQMMLCLNNTSDCEVTFLRIVVEEISLD
jgi:hypothetical protein